MDCPNCKTDLGDPVDFEEEPILWTEDEETWYSWHYICPNCGKKYCHTKYFKVVNTTMEEE